MPSAWLATMGQAKTKVDDSLRCPWQSRLHTDSPLSDRTEPPKVICGF